MIGHAADSTIPPVFLRTVWLQLLLLLACILAGPDTAAEPPKMQPPAAPKNANTRPEVRALPNGDIVLGKVRLHREKGCLSFPAKVELDSGVLEVVIATPEGRIHETLLVTDALPLHLQTMLYLLGAKNGPRLPDKHGRQGDLIDIDVQWTNAKGDKVREPLENWIRNTETKSPMQRIGWVFTGSNFSDGQLVADIEGNLVVCYSVGATVLDIPSTKGDDDIFFVANPERAKKPGAGAKVRVFMTRRGKE